MFRFALRPVHEPEHQDIKPTKELLLLNVARTPYLLLIMCLSGFLSGCFGGREISFSSPTPFKISVFEDGDRQTLIGQTPLKIDPDDYFGKVLHASANGYLDQYWIILPSGPFSIDAIIRPKDSPVQQIGVNNRLIRLLLESYQALAEGRHDQAITLAKQAEELDNRLAGPLIIQGLATLRQGNAEAAKPILLKAISLDPEDQKIKDLVETLP